VTRTAKAELKAPPGVGSSVLLGIVFKNLFPTITMVPARIKCPATKQAMINSAPVMIAANEPKRKCGRTHAAEDKRDQDCVDTGMHDVPPPCFGNYKMDYYPTPYCQHPEKSDDKCNKRNVSFPTHCFCIWRKVTHGLEMPND